MSLMTEALRRLDSGQKVASGTHRKQFAAAAATVSDNTTDAVREMSAASASALASPPSRAPIREAIGRGVNRVPGNRRHHPLNLLPSVEFAAMSVGGGCELEMDFAPVTTPFGSPGDFEPAAILAIQILQQDTAAALAGLAATVVTDPLRGEATRCEDQRCDRSVTEQEDRIGDTPPHGLSEQSQDLANPPLDPSGAHAEARLEPAAIAPHDSYAAELRWGAGVKFPRLKISKEMTQCRAAILADVGLPAAAERGRIVLLASVGGSSDSTLAAAEIAKSLVGTAAGYVLAIDGGIEPRDELTRQPMQPGFASLLSGSRQLSELVTPTQIDGLRMVPRGLGGGLWSQIDDNLATERLAEIRANYAFTVIDAGTWDAAIVDAAGPHVDAVYLIVQAGRSEAAAAKLAARHLGRLGTPIKGCLLVGC